jgi:DNA-binding IclR family transcriptional regulator
MEILGAFDSISLPLTAADVVSRTGLPRSSVFRSLRALVDSGYLHKNSASRKYTLGPRILQLAVAARRQLSAGDLVTMPILELMRQTGETVTFSLLDMPRRTCVYVVESANDLRQATPVGARYPLHLGAGSKVILAYLQPDVADLVLRSEKLSRHQIADVTKHLVEIRAAGYAITLGERVPGVCALAAPVFVADEIYGSVSVGGPIERMKPMLDRYAPAVVASARTLSQRLSARPAAALVVPLRRRRASSKTAGA